MTTWFKCPQCGRSIVPSCTTSDVCPDCEFSRAARSGQQAPVRRERACPDCGKALPPRARYCGECREKRRRATYRAVRQAKVQQLSVSEG